MPTAVPLEIFKAYDVRGLYGERVDGDVAELVGRAFVRVLAGLRGKETEPALRVGLGRDVRLTAPELAGRYRDGMVAEGAHVLDAGMVGTEMLYFLVGSQALDGGLMCTASHNPKAYTGAKLVREGALALSAIPASGRCGRSSPPPGAGRRPARPRRSRSTSPGPSASARWSSIDPGRDVPGELKVVLDGGNGMAGPMIGPVLERLPALELVPCYWEPDGHYRPRPDAAAAREPSST